MASEPDKRKPRRRPVTLDLAADGEAAVSSGAKRSRGRSPEKSPTPADTAPPDTAPAATEPAEPAGGAAPDRQDRPAAPGPAREIAGDETAPAGGDWTAMALSAVLGGVAAVLLLYLLAAIGLAPFLSDGSGRDALATAEALRTEIAGLRETPATGVEDRLTGLAGRLGRLEDNFAALGSRVDGLAAKIDATPAGEPTDLAAIEGRIEILAERLNRLGESPDLDGELAARITRLEERLARAPAPAAANAAVLVAALRVAADAGVAYRAELQSLGEVAIDDEARATLDRHADGGVPSRAALVAAYPAVEAAMIAALDDREPEGTWFDRLFRQADRLVEVRPVAPIAGDSPEAVLSRLAAWVGRGELAAALAERRDLPPEAQAASQQWADEAAERVALDKAVAALAGAANPTRAE